MLLFKYLNHVVFVICLLLWSCSGQRGPVHIELPQNPQPNVNLNEGQHDGFQQIHEGQVLHQGQGLSHQGPGLPQQGQGLPHQGQGLPQQGQGLPQQGQGLRQQGQGLPQQGQGLPQQGQGLRQQGQGLQQQGQGLPQQGQRLPQQGQGLPQQGQGLQQQGQGLPQQGQRLPQQGPGLPQQARPQSSPSQAISQIAACQEDVRKLCLPNKYNLLNNFDVIACLSSEETIDEVTQDCNQHIWEYKVNITRNPKYHKVVEGLCKDAVRTDNFSLVGGKTKFAMKLELIPSTCSTKNVPQCKMDNVDASFISCMMQNRAAIKLPACVDFLTKVAIITFSDYNLIDGFMKACEDDVKRYKCGKLEVRSDDMTSNEFTHSQEEVVACLEDHLDEDSNALSADCDLQITRLAELSSEDFQLDHDLYLKCKNDRETFCANVIAGEGRVYECLFEHKFEAKMSHACRDALTGRQQLVAKDYKASYPLAHQCKIDIEKNGCDIPIAQGTHVAPNEHHVHLSSILMCLENSQRNGVPLTPDCQSELVAFRRMLLSDYEISPEITHNCGTEIIEGCERGLERQGKTIHCLLELAQTQGGIRESCRHALMELIKESEVGKDYRMDPVLTHACQEVIHDTCAAYKEGDPMILGCLMDNLHNKDMTKKCKKAVVELQYFISRDFLVDPVFRDTCQEDAKRLCYTPIHTAAGQQQPDGGEFTLPLNMVISCLYRHIRPSKGASTPISEDCAEEVHQVIKQRSLDFNLNPALESNCRSDLGEFCSSKQHAEGTEFQCLQDNFDKLSSSCREQVQELTKLEGENVMDFDNVLVQECEPMLHEFCANLISEADEGKVMQCLINNKEKMSNKKCAAGITHYQLVEVKNYRLNFNFMKGCEKDIMKFCAQKTLKTEGDIIECLSLQERNAILSNGNTDALSPECRTEITVEKLQLHKNILLNPALAKSCGADQLKHCPGVEAGEAEVIECLREHKEFLQHDCYLALFQFEQEEATNPQLDFQLMSKCKETIDDLCPETEDDADYLLECLVRNKHKMTDKKCQHIVVEREKEMFSDISFNPQLMKRCTNDIDRHCADAKIAAKQEHEEGKDPHGVIYDCLKEKYTDQELTRSCHKHIEFVIREEQQDYQLDPQLVLKCVHSIEELCPPGENNVVECLKKEYFKGSLQHSPTCMVEVAKLLKEGHTDIKADPILEQSCTTDLKEHCSKIPEGHGRLIACLISVADEDDDTKLTAKCRDQLEIRRKMWKKAVNENVKGFHDLRKAVSNSENSNYMFSVMVMVVLLILIMGVFCGRFSRKIAKLRTKKRVL